MGATADSTVEPLAGDELSANLSAIAAPHGEALPAYCPRWSTFTGNVVVERGRIQKVTVFKSSNTRHSANGTSNPNNAISTAALYWIRANR